MVEEVFSCEEAALEVLMYVCLSVRGQVEILACLKVPAGSLRFKGSSEKFKGSSGKVQGRLREGLILLKTFLLSSSQELRSACFSKALTTGVAVS